MKVISGKLGEEILIGPNVVLAFLEVRGERITVGVDAPDDWSVRKAGPALTVAAAAESLSESKSSEESPFFPEFA